MKIKEQFNRYATSYSEHSLIQKKLVNILVDTIDCKLDSVVDLGCGSGAVYKNMFKKGIEFNNFYAVDFAPSMLKLHPSRANVKKIIGDFNSDELFLELSRYSIDLAISSSALQWAKDLDFTFTQISKISNRGAFFLFTSNTFKSLHNLVSIKSPIYSEESIVKAFKKSYSNIKIDRYSFNLEFANTLDMLRYIKKSGVSGDLRVDYRDLKYIIDNYSKDYLEFETILLQGKSRCQN